MYNIPYTNEDLGQLNFFDSQLFLANLRDAAVFFKYLSKRVLLKIVYSRAEVLFSYVLGVSIIQNTTINSTHQFRLVCSLSF